MPLIERKFQPLQHEAAYTTLQRDGLKDPALFSDMLMASPHTDLRLFALNVLPSPREFILPLLYKLSDPIWSVRDCAASHIFRILRNDAAVITSLDPSKTPYGEPRGYSLLTLAFVLKYGERPVVPGKDPCFSPGRSSIKQESSSALSRYNVRSAVMRIMQIAAEKSPEFIPAGKAVSIETRISHDGLIALKRILSETLLSETRRLKLKPLSLEDEMRPDNPDLVNPLLSIQATPFVELLQKVSLFYSAVKNTTDRDLDSVPASFRQERLQEQQRASPMLRTLNSICLGDPRLLEIFVVKSRQKNEIDELP